MREGNYIELYHQLGIDIGIGVLYVVFLVVVVVVVVLCGYSGVVVGVAVCM